MIFKYLPYDKITKTWQDKNIYCSLCLTNKRSRSNSIHNQLFNQKLISFPIEQCHVSNETKDDDQYIYRIFYLVGEKKYNIAKLMQLVKHEVTQLNKPLKLNLKIPKSNWNFTPDTSITISSSTAATASQYFVIDGPAANYTYTPYAAGNIRTYVTPQRVAQITPAEEAVFGENLTQDFANE